MDPAQGQQQLQPFIPAPPTLIQSFSMWAFLPPDAPSQAPLPRTVEPNWKRVHKVAPECPSSTAPRACVENVLMLPEWCERSCLSQEMRFSFNGHLGGAEEYEK